MVLIDTVEIQCFHLPISIHLRFLIALFLALTLTRLTRKLSDKCCKGILARLCSLIVQLFFLCERDCHDEENDFVNVV